MIRRAGDAGALRRAWHRRRVMPWLLRARLVHGWTPRHIAAVIAVVLLVLPLISGPRAPGPLAGVKTGIGHDTMPV